MPTAQPTPDDLRDHRRFAAVEFRELDAGDPVFTTDAEPATVTGTNHMQTDRGCGCCSDTTALIVELRLADGRERDVDLFDGDTLFRALPA